MATSKAKESAAYLEAAKALGLSGGGGTALYTLSTQPTSVAGARAKEYARRAILRPLWIAARSRLMSLYPPVANKGTVYYIDPTAASNGAGTFADPYNVLPANASLADNCTYLFKERTSYIHTTGGDTTIYLPAGSTGGVLGTYDAQTGERVFDPSRRATINGNSRQRVISTLSSNTTNNWAISGLRIIGASHLTDPRGIYIGKPSSASACSGFVVEHCTIEGITPTATDESRLGMGIESYSNSFVCRFNKIVVSDCDGIYVSTASNDGGKSHKIYGNEIVLLGTTTDDGVDCIQTANSGSGGLGSSYIADNWLENRVNTKQVILVQDSASVASTNYLITRNVCLGAEVNVAGIYQGISQKVINVDAINTTVSHNYTSGGQQCIFIAKTAATVYGNICVQYGDDGTTTFRRAIEGYQDCMYDSNTIILDVTNSSTVPMYGIYTGGTSGSTIRNNVVVGRGVGIRPGGNTETNNTIAVTSRAIEGSTVGSTGTPGTGTTTTTDPALTLSGFPTVLGAVAANVSSAEDLYGNSWFGYRGAVQALV